MLYNNWYAITESKKLKKKPIGVKRLKMNLVIWRDENGKAIVQADRCPHRGAKLSDGKIKKGCLECPYHGMRFDPRGQCKEIPFQDPKIPISPKMKISFFETKETLGLIWIWWGETQSVYPEIPWFKELPTDTKYLATNSLTWEAHFTRVIENTLDLAHLPFAHGKIPYWPGPRLKNFYCEKQKNKIINKVDIVSTSKISWKKRQPFELSIALPNVIMGLAGHKRLSGFATATPIDDKTTWMGGGHFCTIPLVGKLMAWLLVRFEALFFFPDDALIAKGTRPIKGPIDSNMLVTEDKAIILWYSYYEAAKTQHEKNQLF